MSKPKKTSYKLIKGYDLNKDKKKTQKIIEKNRCDSIILNDLPSVDGKGIGIRINQFLYNQPDITLNIKDTVWTDSVIKLYNATTTKLHTFVSSKNSIYPFMIRLIYFVDFLPNNMLYAEPEYKIKNKTKFYKTLYKYTNNIREILLQINNRNIRNKINFKIQLQVIEYLHTDC